MKTLDRNIRLFVQKHGAQQLDPPEGMEDALKTVLEQCKLWTDNAENAHYSNHSVQEALMAAEPVTEYKI